MSDYESDDEGQPIERRPSRRYAPRGNVPISDHEPQRTPPILAQVHSQIQPAKRKFPCEVHPDIQTDVPQHNVPRHLKIATVQRMSVSTPRMAPAASQAINSITETPSADLLRMAKLSSHMRTITEDHRISRRTIIVSESLRC